MDAKIIHETKTHGEVSFPYVIYHGKIPEFFHSWPLHWHEEFELIYIEKGEGIIGIRSNTYIAKPGDIFIIPPQVVHSIQQYQHTSMYYFNILFRFSLLEENPNSLCYQKYFLPFLNQQLHVTSYIASTTKLGQELTPYLLSLIGHRNEQIFSYELMIKSHLYAILDLMSKELISFNTKEISKANSIDKLKPALSFLQENYASEITIQQAASLTGFSESHFMKLFKSLTGKSFTQYLNLYRLEFAARELRETNLKIIEIAENVGFHNFSYFIRCFNKTYGCSPSSYRKNVRSQHPEYIKP